MAGSWRSSRWQRVWRFGFQILGFRCFGALFVGLIPLYLGFQTFSSVWIASHLLFIVLSGLVAFRYWALALRVFSLVDILSRVWVSDGHLLPCSLLLLVFVFTLKINKNKKIAVQKNSLEWHSEAELVELAQINGGSWFQSQIR